MHFFTWWWFTVSPLSRQRYLYIKQAETPTGEPSWNTQMFVFMSTCRDHRWRSVREKATHFQDNISKRLYGPRWEYETHRNSVNLKRGMKHCDESVLQEPLGEKRKDYSLQQQHGGSQITSWAAPRGFAILIKLFSNLKIPFQPLINALK